MDTIYDDLSADAKRSLVDRLTEFLTQLHPKSYSLGYVGGLAIDTDSKDECVIPGSPLEEYFWDVPEI